MADEKEQIRRQILLQQAEMLVDDKDLAGLKTLLADQWESDVAEIVESVDNDSRRMIFNALDKTVAAEVLGKVNEATRDELFDLLEDSEIRTIFTELDHDDAADLIAELPEHEARQVLDSLDHQDSVQIQHLLRYSEDSAGGIMDPVLISVPENATVAEAIEKIRAAEIDEDFYTVYVVDAQDKYVGDVRLRLLLTKPANTRIADLVDRDCLYVTTEMDQEEVRNVFTRHELIVIPVLDKNHHLAGRITADRVLEVAEEEAVEDLYTMAGTTPDELDSFSAFNAARIRMTWILPCMFGTAITALVQTYFKTHDLLIFATASVFSPMVSAISGNTGLQTSAIVVSGLATGHLAALRFGQVLSREIRIALVVALSCAVLSGVLCVAFGHFNSTDEAVITISHLAFALATAMFSAIMVSTTLGLALPFLFKRAGIDPAISSGPLVTTANDSISVAIYLSLAIALAA